MPRTPYREQSGIYLRQAGEELARGDARQASEKGWGAASQMLKALADVRGWAHRTHNNLYEAARLLSEEANAPQFLALFRMAGRLHTNFYEGHLDIDDVAAYLQAVTQFVDRTEALLTDS